VLEEEVIPPPKSRRQLFQEAKAVERAAKDAKPEQQSLTSGLNMITLPCA
jgi:hypothetical protein